MRLWNENDQKQELEFLQSLNCENSWMNKEQQLQYIKKGIHSLPRSLWETKGRKTFGVVVAI